ncbi:amidohydrolase family protein [Haloferula chungangensis]|uniref:Amidohydrolase family protein n=1 Tax=Haloferula chungangensis TaxID=1048331 RepID=A0ABW2LA40_9BACT
MIDSHHHLWAYSKEEYGWIPDGSPLAEDQLLPELESVTLAAGVKGTVAVQARQLVEESDFLLDLAAQSDLIRGVVGWVPLIDEDVDEDLARLATKPKFKGVRHVLQDETDEYFLRDDFHRGLAMIPAHNLRYDLLLFQRQLPVAIQLVDRQPELGIVVDHIAKPEAHIGRIEEAWRRGMRELAKRDNVIGVKFSGLITEFPHGEIDIGTVEAYFHETLEVFGSERVMFGTDWPVCLLRSSYRDWAKMVSSTVSSLSDAEQEKILTANAIRVYQL